MLLILKSSFIFFCSRLILTRNVTTNNQYSNIDNTYSMQSLEVSLPLK
jgi:hypothetical protein